MAEVSKPMRRNQVGRLSDQMPPPQDNAPGNLAAAGTRDLNFKVDPDFRRRFKMEAVTRDMTQVDLLRAAFEHYINTKPQD
jgi:hypothetical protein